MLISLNSLKKIAFEPILESDSLQSYHQQRSAYPIGSYTNNARRFNDNNQLFTYHSYKMSSMANYAHNRANIRPETVNVFDITALKKELNNASSNSLEENKSVETEEIAVNQEDENEDKKIEKETSDNNNGEDETQALSSISKELNDNITKIEILSENETKEQNSADNNKNEKTEDIFLLDGFDDEENEKEKYIPEEELDEEDDQVNELVNIPSRYNQQNNLSIYATSMPIKIPERPQPIKNEESSPDKDNTDKEFTPPHIIIARTYQNDEMLHPNHANKYFSVAY